MYQQKETVLTWSSISIERKNYKNVLSQKWFFRKKLLKFYINQGGGGYPIPVKPYQPKQNIVNRAYGLPIIIHLVHDPSNHTDKNIQSVYYSARGITRDTLNRTDLPT
ncbi:hypothetical protein OUZ56_019979 [Daphnia magna]|uniref:Uncharacterized protein n=1 Tax=Daphnia magna TaxID=35525 RepID=A0ABQ9ZD74_9CRUS|nr:hypothetical protein OUZ56_019979 [Daphnia magna]